MSIENKPTLEGKKPGEKCKGCRFAAANKCKLFQQSNAMMETLFFQERVCLFKHMPEKEEIMKAIMTGIEKSTYITEGSQFCNPIAAKVLIEKELEGILWHVAY